MAVTDYSAEYPGARATAEAHADPFDVEPFGLASAADAPRPVVTIVSPPPGGPIGPTEPFVFTVTCSEEIVLQRFNIRTGGPSAPWEVQYRDGEASPGSEVTRAEIEGGLRFSVRRAGAWLGSRIDFEPVFGTAAAVAATNV